MGGRFIVFKTDKLNWYMAFHHRGGTDGFGGSTPLDALVGCIKELRRRG